MSKERKLFVEFPKWVTLPGGERIVVKNRVEEEQALGLPASDPEPEKPPPPDISKMDLKPAAPPKSVAKPKNRR